MKNYRIMYSLQMIAKIIMEVETAEAEMVVAETEEVVMEEVETVAEVMDQEV